MRCRRGARALSGAALVLSLAAVPYAATCVAQAAPPRAVTAPAPQGAANAPPSAAGAPGQPAPAPAPRSLITATFPAQQRAAGDPQLIGRGQALYGINCKACHGADLRGGDLGGPNLLRSPIVLGDQAGEGIIPVVTRGRVPENGGTPMPALPLADADIRAVAAYLHSVLAKQQRQGAPPEGPDRRLDILVGKPEAGRRYFQSHCRDCHSATGDLAGIGRRVPDAAALQDSWVAGRRAVPAGAASASPAVKRGSAPTPAGGGAAGAAAAPGAGAADPRRRVTVSVTLATGEHLTGQLERVDDFVVSLRADDGRYLSFTRRGVPAVTAVEVHDPMARHRLLLTQYSDQDMHDVTAYLATLK